MKGFRLAGAICASAAMLLVGPSVASAANFTVNSSADSGGGSLRDAITAAGGNAEADVITITATGPIQLLTALPTINDDLQINGPGENSLVISGGTGFRVFDFDSGTSSLSKLTVANGHQGGTPAAADTFEVGGGILNNGVLTLDHVIVRDNTVEASTTGNGNEAFAEGGGIFNGGTLSVIRSTIRNNSALAETTGGGTSADAFAGGGGIASDGDPLTVVASTLNGNAATADASGVFNSDIGSGGGIRSQGILDAERSTITRNSAFGGIISSFGGGITQAGSFGFATLRSLTITSNRADFDAANFFAEDDDMAQFQNTILSDPDGNGNNCPTVNPVSVISLGYNIDSGTSCGFAGTGDLSNTDPRLDPDLRNNGGPTQTIALLSDSPAIDKGILTNGNVDQRDFYRPVEFLGIPNTVDGSDIGAFEFAPNCDGKGFATIVARPSGGTITGTSRNDVILGSDSKDTIRGGSGDDVLCGFKKKDKLLGQSGKDTILGHDGKDLLNGGPGKDKCQGGNGRDTLRSC